MPCLVALPCREVYVAEGVAQMTVLSVRHEPVFIVLEKLLEVESLHHLLSLLLEDDAQIVRLGIVHTFIVYLLKLVKLLAQSLKLGSFLLVGNLRQLTQVGILRVQGEDADAGVRVGVSPSVGRCGVVDRQHLQHLLLGFSHPVNHHLQVAEISHAEASFGAQGEHGNESAGKFSVADFEESLIHVVDTCFSLLQFRYFNLSVEASFPEHVTIIGGGNELQFSNFLFESLYVQICHPFVVVVLIHL